MSAGIYELEAVVKDLYFKDPDNPDPDLYMAIRNLAEKLLVVKQIATTREEIQLISHHLASDLYMDILSGKTRVRSWTKYVWLRLYKYRELYVKDKGKQFFRAKDTSQVDAIRDLHQGSRESTSLASTVEYEDLIERLPEVFREKYQEFNRYTPSHQYYEGLLISVIITIVRDELTLYKIPKHLSGYVRMMSRVMLKESYNYIKEYSGDSQTEVVHDFTSYFEVVYDG